VKQHNKVQRVVKDIFFMIFKLNKKTNTADGGSVFSNEKV